MKAFFLLVGSILPIVALAFQSPRYVTTTTTVSSSSSSCRFMFGGLFGGNDNDEKKNNKDGDLLLLPNLGDSDVQYNGLSDYIQKWGLLFETDPKGMGLTTPIRLLPSTNKNNNIAEQEEESEPEEEEESNDVESYFGIRLVFQSTNTGYKSKKEEDETSNNNGDSSTKKKKKKKLEGGVEILVEKLISGTIQVRARRCDFDEDTMIKEMSEETIVKELRKAIDVWKREAK